ncbi:hypothetical protein L7F22_022180 [Adiantum nelumboides]|nr:hypothetical protein [Adiantum nelumboides]
MAHRSFHLTEGRVFLLLLLISPPILITGIAAAGSYTPSFAPRETEKFWVSEAGRNYMFGFKPLAAGEYLLAIWHSKDLTQTPIWWAANGDNPAIAKQGTIFLYSEISNLLELYISPSKPIWKSGNSQSSTGLRFLDTGNLQLLHGNTTVWETFQDQRNTLMLMSLQASMLVNKPRLLQSTKNQPSYLQGKFHMATYRSFDVRLFGIDVLNNQYVYMKDYNVSVNISGPGGHISIGNQLDGTAHSSEKPSLERLTLDFDGNLRVYRWLESNSTWIPVWALLQDWSLHCRADSPCGPFGICKADVDENAVRCKCPSGYTPISSTNMSKGCTTTRTPPNCANLSDQQVVMVEQPDSDFYYNDLTWFTGVYHIEECKKLCLSECKCVAATFSGSTCFLKGNTTLGYLENGITAANSPVLLMKLLELPSDATPKRARYLVPVIVVLIFVGVVAGGICLWWRQRWLYHISRWRDEHSAAWNMVLSAGPVRFSYKTLVEVTCNFSHLLGEGGFGKVYKGWIKDLESSLPAMVAVKVLKHNHKERQFIAEIVTFSKIHHLNLVDLLGFCVGGRHGEKKLLVYEYMENCSLDKYLSPSHMEQPLPWSVRLSIAAGVARGIAYLHHECSPPILHCDIKPQNVLLDENFTPKVADFGFATRFGEPDQSHLTMSSIRGTRGYMAPDWLKSGGITPKADVYSFGMLLLELIHGLNTTGDDHMSLIEWGFDCLAAGYVPHSHLHECASAHHNRSDNVLDVDPKLDTQLQLAHEKQEECTKEQQLHLLRLALWCVHQLPACRPSMADVVQMIEGSGDINDPPNPAEATIPMTACESISSHILTYSDLSSR